MNEPDLITRLNQIADRQGKPHIDPTRIDGEGAPSPPPFVERPPVDLSQVPEPAEYFDDDEPQYSPLIPQPPASPPMLDLPRPDLAVAGNDAGSTIASYLGREVTLLEIEAVAVRKVVLRALQRQVRALLAEIEALTPKRRRKKKGAGVATVSAGSSAALDSQPAPKRRGRPRKVKPE